MKNSKLKRGQKESIHYFIHAKKHNIHKFLNLIEEKFYKIFNFWPYSEILLEGYVLREVNPITAWKSEKGDVKIIIVEEQSYKYEYKYIALYFCDENFVNQIKKFFIDIDNKLKKYESSIEKRRTDEKVVAWVKEHKFILQIFGIGGIAGSALWLLFNRPQDGNTVLDRLIYLLSKIIPILLLIGMLIFLIIMYIRIFRVISSKPEK